MSRKRFSDNDIIRILREVEVNIGDGMDTDSACRKSGISPQTYYRWRGNYGQMTNSEVKRLKALEQENVRLKKIVAALELDKLILKEGLDFLDKKKA